MFTVDSGVGRYRRSAVAILLSPFIESIRKLCEHYLNDLERVMRFCYKVVSPRTAGTLTY